MVTLSLGFDCKYFLGYGHKKTIISEIIGTDFNVIATTS